jgi:hypothetical protein
MNNNMMDSVIRINETTRTEEKIHRVHQCSIRNGSYAKSRIRTPDSDSWPTNFSSISTRWLGIRSDMTEDIQTIASAIELLLFTQTEKCHDSYSVSIYSRCIKKLIQSSPNLGLIFSFLVSEFQLFRSISTCRKIGEKASHDLQFTDF